VAHAVEHVEELLQGVDALVELVVVLDQREVVALVQNVEDVLVQREEVVNLDQREEEENPLEKEARSAEINVETNEGASVGQRVEENVVLVEKEVQKEAEVVDPSVDQEVRKEVVDPEEDLKEVKEVTNKEVGVMEEENNLNLNKAANNHHKINHKEANNHHKVSHKIKVQILWVANNLPLKDRKIWLHLQI